VTQRTRPLITAGQKVPDIYRIVIATCFRVWWDLDVQDDPEMGLGGISTPVSVFRCQKHRTSSRGREMGRG